MKRVFQDKNKIAYKICQNIRDIRIKQGLTQAQLAEIADIDNSYVGFLETGRRNVTVFMLVRFARALKCKFSDIMKDIL